jgi:hypothetical protein
MVTEAVLKKIIGRKIILNFATQFYAAYIPHISSSSPNSVAANCNFSFRERLT